MSETVNHEVTEQKVLTMLSNEPSKVYQYEDYKFIFQRPAYRNKYKGRVWANKRTLELGFNDIESEDPQLSLYFSFFGTLNVNVVRIFKVVDGKNVEITFDPREDVDYQFLFEKFIEEEIYSRVTDNEDRYVYQVMQLMSDWKSEGTVEESDIKNS